jgi:pimeloyl-ACP methyl ester carboxylesterase
MMDVVHQRIMIFMVTNVEFPSEGVNLRGRYYLPKNKNTKPAIVIMGHGFSATITGMTADKYAESFYNAGFAVLLYDHKSFGASEGEPRYEINTWVQARGYIDAIEYVMKLTEIDTTKIAIWGDSISASFSIMVASIDKRVKAFALQVPACGSDRPPPDPDGSKFEAIKDTLLNADLSSRESVVGPMPVVSPDQIGNPSALKPITAFRWFIEYGGRFETKWENQVTYVNPKPSIPYHPGLCASHLDVPLLMVVSPDDEMPGAKAGISRLVFNQVQAPKEWFEIEGGHFGLLYYPSPIFDQASEAQINFLKKYLS